MSAFNPHELAESLSHYLAIDDDVDRLTGHILGLQRQRALALENLTKASETIVEFLESLPAGHACQFGDQVLSLGRERKIVVHKVVVVEQVYPRTLTTIQIKELAS